MNVRDFIREREKIARRFPDQSKRNAAMRRLVREAGATVIIMENKVTGWRLADGKIVCVKYRHKDQAGADAEVVRAADSNWNNHRVPVRSYQCPYCFGWHLTSQAAQFEKVAA
ncbi:hypothetical protein AB7813_08250 [Tardiphaga sp. 20_F10_N6_6]|uniref:hypothetical protein n=1 Tax=Tardiphaga sp. 20_F10_N6_6 TaxID=3240788 RepID=UPI003F8C0313